MAAETPRDDDSTSHSIHVAVDGGFSACGISVTGNSEYVVTGISSDCPWVGIVNPAGTLNVAERLSEWAPKVAIPRADQIPDISLPVVIGTGTVWSLVYAQSPDDPLAATLSAITLDRSGKSAQVWTAHYKQPLLQGDHFSIIKTASGIAALGFAKTYDRSYGKFQIKGSFWLGIFDAEGRFVQEYSFPTHHVSSATALSLRSTPNGLLVAGSDNSNTEVISLDERNDIRSQAVLTGGYMWLENDDWKTGPQLIGGLMGSTDYHIVTLDDSLDIRKQSVEFEVGPMDIKVASAIGQNKFVIAGNRFFSERTGYLPVAYEMEAGGEIRPLLNAYGPARHLILAAKCERAPSRLIVLQNADTEQNSADGHRVSSFSIFATSIK